MYQVRSDLAGGTYSASHKEPRYKEKRGKQKKRKEEKKKRKGKRKGDEGEEMKCAVGFGVAL